jgi:hypothetical protein
MLTDARVEEATIVSMLCGNASQQFGIDLLQNVSA